MRVFADYHHGGLYHALHTLFVERLGWELFRPVGLEWAENNIWLYSQNPPTQKQYLDLKAHELRKDGYYYWRDNAEEIDHKCLTWDQFRKMKIDYIISSVCQHEASFDLLQRNLKPEAALIRLLGNSGEPVDYNVSKNIIDTTNLYKGREDTKRVVWHQEFPKDLFYFTQPSKKIRIRSYLNCFNETHYYDIWQRYKKEMPEVEWKMHGHNGDDGFISPVSALAQSMRDSSFVWHIKEHGEGFGHIIHNALAVGRPVITVKKHYEGKLVEPLLIDDVTCIDLGLGDMEQNIRRINYWSKPENLVHMCRNARDVFDDHVDFDADFKNVKQFLKDIKK